MSRVEIECPSLSWSVDPSGALVITLLDGALVVRLGQQVQDSGAERFLNTPIQQVVFAEDALLQGRLLGYFRRYLLRDIAVARIGGPVTQDSTWYRREREAIAKEWSAVTVRDCLAISLTDLLPVGPTYRKKLQAWLQQRNAELGTSFVFGNRY